MNPGTSEMHFVAALDDVPEMRGVLALFEGVATGAADGYGRMAGRPGRHPAAPGPGPGQRPGQPAQRPAGPHPGGQHRRRPRHLPQGVRRPARVRHRDGGPQRVGLHPAHRPVRRRGGRRRRHGGRGPRARPGRWPPSSWPPTPRGPRRPGVPTAPAVASPGPAGASAVVDAEAVEAAAKVLRSGQPAALFVGGRVVGASRCGPTRGHRRGHRGPAAVRDLPGPPRARRRPGARWTAWATWPSSPRCSWTAWPTWCWSTPPRRSRSSPTRASPATWCPRAARSTTWPARPTTPAPRWPRWWPPSVADAAGLGWPAPQPARPAVPTGALTAETVVRGPRGAAARGGHRVRRGQHLRAVRPRRHRRRAAPRLADPDRRGHRPGPARGRGGGGGLPRIAG